MFEIIKSFFFVLFFSFRFGIFHDFYLLEKQMAVAILKHVIKKIQYRYPGLYCVCLPSSSIAAWIHTHLMESILIMCNQCLGSAIKRFPSAFNLRKNSGKQKRCSLFCIFIKRFLFNKRFSYLLDTFVWEWQWNYTRIFINVSFGLSQCFMRLILILLLNIKSSFSPRDLKISFSQSKRVHLYQ